ncbi:MAG: DUF1501 domain-containing protein [Acidobacteria bacterium]|nr:DUF1501 domain-containing protein [Acidobacteriota bacterium]MBI3664533.1 DUF1501 domain-containing protein [Acidobacteriota bacterium]
MNITRRYFLKSSGVAMVGLSAMPSFLTRAVLASPLPAGGKRKILVVLFQRGAMDGLNAVIPYGESDYYRLRPTIAIPQPRPGRGDQQTAIDLDGFFALHPSLALLEPLFKQKQLAIVHAAGSPDTTRSHFDAQDYMESGTPGRKSTEDGWLNRALQTEKVEAATPFRAVAMGTNLPRALKGAAPAVALPDVRQFQMMAASPMVEGGFEAVYAQTVDKALRGTGTETFEAIDMLRKANPQRYQPENGATYPQGRFGQNLLQVAQLIKANIGLEVAFLDSGGWDHHVNEGAVQGQLSNLLRDLGQGLAAFHRDLGDRMADIVLVTMSEFGRTAAENGTRGTDHGHANCMFVMGGDVNGGKVHGKWPGLGAGQLYEGRDLALTTDFRTVLSELLARHMGHAALSTVFPGFSVNSKEFLGVLKA